MGRGQGRQGRQGSNLSLRSSDGRKPPLRLLSLSPFKEFLNLGIGHGALGIGHWAWEEDKVDKVDKVAIFLSEVLMVGNLRSDFSPCLP
ncbi:hypothetical protein VF13_33120, partial [Nostoc linckia z16]